MTSSTTPSIFQSPGDEVLEIALRNGCEIKQARAGAVVLPQGEVGGCLYCLRSGLLYAAIGMKGKKLTLDVFLEGNVFAPMESFVFETPSAFSIEALTAAEYVEIPRNVLQRMLADTPELHQELATHHRLWNMRMTRRLIELMTTSPLERYLHFTREHPDLLNRLPQYMIASMLGISPESLSRVRGRLSTRTKR